MRDRLKELLNNSYAPYSNFRVSAVVVMKDGTSLTELMLKTLHMVLQYAQNVALYLLLYQMDIKRMILINYM